MKADERLVVTGKSRFGSQPLCYERGKS